MFSLEEEKEYLGIVSKHQKTFWTLAILSTSDYIKQKDVVHIRKHRHAEKQQRSIHILSLYFVY